MLSRTIRGSSDPAQTTDRKSPNGPPSSNPHFNQKRNARCACVGQPGQPILKPLFHRDFDWMANQSKLDNLANQSHGQVPSSDRINSIRANAKSTLRAPKPSKSKMGPTITCDHRFIPRPLWKSKDSPSLQYQQTKPILSPPHRQRHGNKPRSNAAA